VLPIEEAVPELSKNKSAKNMLLYGKHLFVLPFFLTTDSVRNYWCLVQTV
jgi:hypothetical protein